MSGVRSDAEQTFAQCVIRGCELGRARALQRRDARPGQSRPIGRESCARFCEELFNSRQLLQRLGPTSEQLRPTHGREGRDRRVAHCGQES